MIYFEIVLGSYRRIVKRVQIDLIYICVYLSHSVIHLFVTSWTVAHQAPLSMGFSRQEYCNELPFPSPGDLPDPGIEPGSPTLQADSLPSEPPGKSGTRKTRGRINGSLLELGHINSSLLASKEELYGFYSWADTLVNVWMVVILLKSSVRKLANK